jgi:hypothetical protein
MNKKAFEGQSLAPLLHTDAQSPLAISVSKFCQLTSLGRTSTFKLIAQGKLETKSIGGRTLILWRSVEGLLGLNGSGSEK